MVEIEFPFARLAGHIVKNMPTFPFERFETVANKPFAQIAKSVIVVANQAPNSPADHGNEGSQKCQYCVEPRCGRGILS